MNKNAVESEEKNTEKTNAICIGWREWVSLPELGIRYIKAKVDTGARTSALHAFAVERYKENHKDKILFHLHPLQHNTTLTKVCKADLTDIRWVTDSGGHSEERFVIQTTILIGTNSHEIEITLTNRDTMTFRMLLGRSALKDQYLVNSAKSYLIGKKELYT